MRRSAVFSPRRPGRGSQNYPADWLPEQPTGPTRLYSFLNGPNPGLTHVAILGKKERKENSPLRREKNTVQVHGLETHFLRSRDTPHALGASPSSGKLDQSLNKSSRTCGLINSPQIPPFPFSLLLLIFFDI